MSDTQKSAAAKPKRAPMLYAIAGFKIFKGGLLLVTALFIFTLAKQDLPGLFDSFLRWIHLDPENKFFAAISDRLGELTPAGIRQFASLPFIYGLFLFASGTGLALRAKWAIWLAIGESAFFIPIEIYELVRRRVPDTETRHAMFAHPKIGLAIVLAVNVFIVWYLYKNRERLFRHHHSH
jgi:uncharacterized membrane protein (DUF2068 family)